MNDSKTVRDALLKYSADEAECHARGMTHVPKTASEALLAFDRMIETPAPQGWKLVPIEPELDQLKAGRSAWGKACMIDDIADIYKAMLSAAPTPAPTDGYVTVKLGFPNITGSKELVAVPVEFLMSDGSFDKLQNSAPTEKVDFTNMMLPLKDVLTEKEEYARRIGWNQAIDYFQNLANTGRLR